MSKKAKDETGLLTLVRDIFAPFKGDGEIELRAIPQDRSQQIRRDWVSSASELNSFAEEWGARDSGYSTYFGVCKRKDVGGGKRSDILGASCLWVDIDCLNHGWDTEKCLLAVHKMTGVLQPSAIVKSGGGLHLYWYLDRVYTDFEKIEATNKRLADTFSGDAVHDVTRVMRLPDTWNPKRKARAELVYSYGFKRKTLDEMLTAAFDHRKDVLYDGEWISAVEAEERMAKDTASKDEPKATKAAYSWASVLRGGKVAEKDLDRMWETEVRYHPPRGYIGIDEAVMRTTARLWCTTKITRDMTAEKAMDTAVNTTLRYIRNFNKRGEWDSGQWDEGKQKAAIRQKLARWVPKWEEIKAIDAAAKKRKAKESGEAG